MGKRALILIGTLAVVILASTTWVTFRKSTREPVYEDRLLSGWLVQLTDADTQVARDQAAVAIRSIGTNAIPTLLQMLREKESPYWSEYLAWRQGSYNPFGWHFGEPPNNLGRARAGFDELGNSAAPAVPALVEILNENLSRDCQHDIAIILGNIGPDAKAAVPSFLRLATSPKNFDHYIIFDALGKIHAEPQLVVPVFVQVISNSPRDRYSAVSAIRNFGTNASPAVPALVALFNDPSLPPGKPGFVSDRENIERALQYIDPETYARVMTNLVPVPAP